MSIATKIEGSPESIHSSADWLRGSLGSGVREATESIGRCRTTAEAGWEGAASTGFQAKMATASDNGDTLATDAEAAGRAFDNYADDLHTAQIGMRRAREIAGEAGLELTDTHILAPGASPTPPQQLPGDGSATSQMVQAHNDAVAAQQEHARKMTAYRAAHEEAVRARGILTKAQDTLEAVGRGFTQKKYLNAASFVNSVVGGYIKMHKSILLRESDRLLKEANDALINQVRHAPGSTQAQRLVADEAFYRKAAHSTRARAINVGRRFGSKIPLVGLGITALGVGYDISNGKPPARAIVGGAGGLAGGALGAAAVTAVVATAPVSVVAVGAVAGGVVVGMAAEAAWDHLVPQDVKDSINDGLEATGSAIADGAGAVVGGVQDAWDAVF